MGEYTGAVCSTLVNCPEHLLTVQYTGELSRTLVNCSTLVNWSSLCGVKIMYESRGLLHIYGVTQIVNKLWSVN